jgi:hypothetical protein
MLQGLVVLYVISFVLGIHIVACVGRTRTLDGVLSLFVPGSFFHALCKCSGDVDHDKLRLPLGAYAAAALFACNAFHVASATAGENRPAVAQSSARAASEDAIHSNEGAVVRRSSSSCSTSAPDKAVPASPAMRTPPSPEPATEAEPPRRATPAELQRLAEKVDFLRGRFVREAIGMRLDIPRNQHLLAGADARHADTALRGEYDAYLVGWMIAANKTLTDANLRIVRVRWRHDGLVAAESTMPDADALVEAAHARAYAPRLFGSGGSLLRYDSPPARDGATVVWSEERQLDGAKASVFDCHAVRLARKGVLEFSIAGVDAKAAKSCVGELSSLAASVQFDAGTDYPAQAEGEPPAPYTLDALIAQTQ